MINFYFTLNLNFHERIKQIFYCIFPCNDCACQIASTIILQIVLALVNIYSCFVLTGNNTENYIKCMSLTSRVYLLLSLKEWLKTFFSHFSTVCNKWIIPIGHRQANKGKRKCKDYKEKIPNSLPLSPYSSLYIYIYIFVVVLYLFVDKV